MKETEGIKMNRAEILAENIEALETVIYESRRTIQARKDLKLKIPISLDRVEENLPILEDIKKDLEKELAELLHGVP